MWTQEAIEAKSASAPPPIPPEWEDLARRIGAMPEPWRRELQPALEEAMEQARLRGNVLGIAREALRQLRLDLQMTRFDLEATRREREQLRSRLDGSGSS